MSTITTHTKNGEPFDPVTEDLHPHGEDPDVGVPSGPDELSGELDRLASKLYDASLILRRVSSRFEDSSHEHEHATIFAAATLSNRAHERLQEAADALSSGHTGNTGYRMHDVTLPAENAHALLNDWMMGYPSDRAQGLAGTIYAVAWTLDYVGRRLHFLVQDCELPYLEG